MNNTSHTPGPWRVGAYATATVHPTPGRMPAGANANLIAAAPELLAALQQVRHDIATSPMLPHRILAITETTLKELRAAIAKAEGGTV